MFNVPVVLFLFKRVESTKRIIDRLRQVKPSKLYVICDQGRNEVEVDRVALVRELIDREIDWDCEVIKDYAQRNRGVYDQIGMGAIRVFEKEDRAIFLEDDNLPEPSFFYWCEQMLDTYADDRRIVWICGTNYLGKSDPSDGSDIYFTQHLLPCGWASWSSKFLKYYDRDLSMTDKEGWLDAFKNSYSNRQLFIQQRESVLGERERRDRGERYRSWDFHMIFSIKMQGLLGIAPCCNQITNIGVDEYSTHGSKTGNTMTDRFCNVPSYPISVPCKLPENIHIDNEFERKITKIILQPVDRRLKDFMKRILKVPRDQSIAQWIMGKANA